MNAFFLDTKKYPLFLGRVILGAFCCMLAAQAQPLSPAPSPSEKATPLTLKQIETLHWLLPSFLKNSAATLSSPALLSSSLSTLSSAFSFPVKDKSIDLESLIVTGDSFRTRVILQLSAHAFYTLETDPPQHSLTLTLEHTVPLKNLAMPAFETYANTALKAIVLKSPDSMYAQNTNCVLTFFTAPMIALKGLHESGNAPRNLVLDFVLSIPSSSAMPLKKKTKNIQKNSEPVFIHITKHTDYGKDNNLDDLETIEKKALRYLFEKQPQKAMDLLLNPPASWPPIETHKNYYFLLAQAFQQADHFSDALMIYQKLLTHFPEDAALWASTGVCLENTGQLKMAYQAYEKAYSLPALPASLKTLLENKLNLCLK